jgi:DNA helicase-2/ATP-dependent DNA helicase PcrA
VDQSFLEYPQTGGRGFRGADKNRFGSPGLREEPEKYSQEAPSPKMRKVIRTDSDSSFSSGIIDLSAYCEGDQVEHERFGFGTIISIEGQPPNKTALVEFKKDGKKKLLLRFAKLRKI